MTKNCNLGTCFDLIYNATATMPGPAVSISSRRLSVSECMAGKKLNVQYTANNTNNLQTHTHAVHVTVSVPQYHHHAQT